jgi:hypothetical protein
MDRVPGDASTTNKGECPGCRAFGHPGENNPPQNAAFLNAAESKPCLCAKSNFAFYAKGWETLRLRHLSQPAFSDPRSLFFIPRINHRPRNVFEVLHISRRQHGMGCHHNPRDHRVANVNRTASSAALVA